MSNRIAIHFVTILLLHALLCSHSFAQKRSERIGSASVLLKSKSLKTRDSSLKLDGLFYETANGRTMLPAEL